MPAVTVVQRDYPTWPLRPVHLARTADGENRQRRQGHWLEHQARGRIPAGAEWHGRRRGPQPGSRASRRISTPSRPFSAWRPKPTARLRSRHGRRSAIRHRRDHTHLARPKEDEKIRFRDVIAQPRKIISSPTWSGIESDKVCYNAGYTNVHELIPWRTLTGRQQLYQDHLWMRAFGEALRHVAPADRHQGNGAGAGAARRTATRRSC